MIRLLSFVFIVACSTIVLAQPLYKWVEPDGSITFSVTPPSEGITYETVSTPEPGQSLKPATSDAVQAEKAPALEQGLPEPTPSTSTFQQLAPQQAVQTNTQQRRDSLREPETNNVEGYPARQTGNVMGAATSAARSTPKVSTEMSVAQNARARKKRQCEDLRKRVVSLERRLQTRLTPDDMDNTVVHMARYQRSYDQHCVQ